MEEISLEKINTKGLQRGFDRRERPFFPPNCRKDYSEENWALAWERDLAPPLSLNRERNATEFRLFMFV